MKLYEIDKEIQVELDALERCEETGETPESILERLEKLALARDQKLNALCAVIKNYEANAEIAKGESQRLKSRAAQLEKWAESARWYLKRVLAGEKWTNGIHSVSYRKSEAVEVEKEELIPVAYMKEHLSYEPDKEQIKADIKAGATIPGVRLERRLNLQVK